MNHEKPYVPTCDDDDPQYMFSTTPTALLVAAANGQVDLDTLALKELAARGLDTCGKWVGFDAPAKGEYCKQGHA